MFVTIAIALTLGAQITDKPKVFYNKVEDITHIALEFKDVPLRKGSNLSAHLFADHDGDVRKKFAASDHVRLGFVRWGTKLKWQDDHDVEILCGPELVPTLSTDYTHLTLKGTTRCTEFLTVHLTLGTLKKFLERDRDRHVTLGADDPFTFDAADRKRMLAFVKFLEEGGG